MGCLGVGRWGTWWVNADESHKVANNEGILSVLCMFDLAVVVLLNTQ